MIICYNNNRITSVSPERQQDTVAYKNSQAPHDGHPHADVAEVVVGSREKVPGNQFLRSEALSHLILNYVLDAFLPEIEDITQCKIYPCQRFGMGPAQLPDLLLHRAIILLDDPWDQNLRVSSELFT